MWMGGGWGGGGWGGGGMGPGGMGMRGAWRQANIPMGRARWTGAGTLRHSDFDEEVTGKIYDHAVVSRLIKYFLPHRKALVLALVGMLVYQATFQVVPRLVGWGLDAVSRGNIGSITRFDGTSLTWIAIIFLVVQLVSWGAQWLELFWQAKMGQAILMSFRTEMFDHLMKLSHSFFDQNEVGRIMSRVQNDVTAIQEFMARGLLTLFGDFLSLALVVYFVFQMDVQLALVALSTIPFVVLALAIWQRYARTAFMRVRQAIAMVNASLQENISGVRVIQSLSREEENLRRFDEVNAQNLQATIRQAQVSALVMPIVEVAMAVSLAVVILYGGARVLNGQLTVGALLAFALYVQRFFEPVRMLVMEYSQIQRAMIAGARIFEVLDQVPEIQEKPDAIELPPVKGEVVFEHVDFHYFEEYPVLRDISLRVEPGQTVAIVGPTGAGKTSLVALINRSYDVKGGRILIDGYDIRDVTLESLRKQIGVVLQDPILFSGTIRDNIRYGRPDATDEEVIAAAKAVGVHDFIMHLEHGYDTEVHERGQGMSLGQRQLVCFARAILTNPRILILDEATANIDTYSEMLIQRALKELLKGRTSFVIAHRLSTIRDADRIIVMEKGRIVEDGKHEELLARSGLYAQLYAMNFMTVESPRTSSDGAEAAAEQRAQTGAS